MCVGAAEDDVVLSVQLSILALEFLEHLRGSRWSQKNLFQAQKLWRFVSALAKPQQFILLLALLFLPDTSVLLSQVGYSGRCGKSLKTKSGK